MKRMNYMKLIALCTLLLTNTVWADETIEPGALLRCLALEEAHLHQQKRGGPQYKLNQLFFNEWSGNPRLELVNDVYQKVCGNQARSASIRLLEAFMLGGKRIFKANRGLPDDPMTAMRRITLDELRRQMPQVFFTYVADLEVFAPTARCLEEQIPELANLREKYRYLESEISLEFLDNYKAQWKTIFTELDNWQAHFQKCQERANKAAKNNQTRN